MFKRKVGESLNPSIICSGQNPEFFGVFVGLHGSGFVFFSENISGDVFTAPWSWCHVVSGHVYGWDSKIGALVGYGCFQK